MPSHFKNSDFLYSVVNYSDFANNPNKDEIKELLQPRSRAFGRGVACALSGAGGATPLAIVERRRAAKVVAIRWLASERRRVGCLTHSSRAFQTAQEKLRRVTRSEGGAELKVIKGGYSQYFNLGTVHVD